MPGSPLRNAEWKLFKMAVSDAFARAAKGDFSAGATILAAGMHRVEEWLTGGEPWAEELLDAYRKTSFCYREKHGLSDEASVAGGDTETAPEVAGVKN